MKAATLYRPTRRWATHFRKRAFIDLAYIDFHPVAVPGLNVYAGKMNNPFYAVSKNRRFILGQRSRRAAA